VEGVMQALLWAAIFIFGVIIGSFLNVCIHRLPKGESIVTPGSHCPKCGHGIPWYDNMPILSYIFLNARCRFCKTHIPVRYFLVELLSGSLLLALFISFGLTTKFFAYSTLTSGLIVATFVDFEIQEIPDEISLGGLLFGLTIAFLFPSLFAEQSRIKGLFDSALGALAGGGSIFSLGVIGKAIFKKDAMGEGDVKFMAMIGAFLGWKLIMLTFFIAPAFGSIVGVVLKIKEGREIIPYGPYLSLGALTALLCGEKILGMLFYGIR